MILRKIILFSVLISSNVLAETVTIGQNPSSSITSSITLVDDISLKFGTGAPANCLWETADANANALLCAMPEGGAVDVPGFIIGDASALNVDLGLFNGRTDPFLAILSDDQTKSLILFHDGTNGILDTTFGAISIPDGLTTTTVIQNNLTTFSAGAAITGGSYQIGRDSDATNQLHLNAPSGASIEMSINDSPLLIITSSTINTNNQPIINIGNSGTDFGGGGQLTLGNIATTTGTTTLTLNNGAHTAITTAVPALDINSFTNTVNSGSTLSLGYAATIDPPTYQGVAGGGAETVTDIYTLYLPGPGVVGANLNNTSIGTLWVDSGDVRLDGLTQNTPQTVSVADNGAGTPALVTITPSAGVIQVTCNDPHNCNVTMSETGAKNGVSIILVNMSANSVVYTDSAGVSELAGGFTAGQYDSISMTYQSDRWVEDARSNN